MMKAAGHETQIRSAAARLHSAFAPVEAVFLGAGGHLTEAVAALGLLTEGFLAMASRLEDRDSVEALAALTEVSRRIGGLSGGTQASRSRLDPMHARANALGQRIARLRKVIAEVNVLAVNAKVEAAHVTARGVDFTVFTREIGRLGQLATERLDLLAAEVAGLLGAMARARAGLDEFNRNHRQSLEAVSARLGHGLAAASLRRTEAARAVRDLGGLSRSMAGEIALAVEALQVGDITRQRAEHIAEALATLLDVLDGAAGGALPPEHRPVLTATVCRLQGAQARHAADELRQGLERIRDNLGGLSANLAALPERSAVVTGGGDEPRSSFLSDLGREFDEAYQLLGRYAAARAGVEEVVADIAAVVEGMVGHIGQISSIEADMRVMGLNATFKCGRLGAEGRALSVIAQELRGYSNRTAEEGRAIMAELSDLVVHAREVGESEKRGEAAGIEAEMAAAVRVVEEIGAASGDALVGLQRAGERARAALAEARRLLDAHAGFTEALAECGAILEAVAAEGGEAGAGELDGIRDEVLDLLRSRYTMASERKVHEMFGDAAALSPTAPSADAEVEVDDLLF